MIDTFKRYNSIKSWTLWVQQPWKAYAKRLKQNWNYALALPLAIPFLGVALAGKLSCKLLSLCNREVRKTAVKVMETALYKRKLLPRKAPAGPIRHGNGEYLVFKREEGSARALTKGEYHSVHDLIQSSHLWTSAYYGFSAEEREAILKNPHAYLQERVKRIDPAFEVAFVPTVMYELFYLECALEEELNFIEERKMAQAPEFLPTDNILDPDITNCTIPMQNPSYCPGSDTSRAHLATTLGNPGLQLLHYQMNTGLINYILSMDADPGKLTFGHLKLLFDGQIESLKKYAKGAATPESERIGKLMQNIDKLSTKLYSPALLALSASKMEKILQNTLQLECSYLAQTHAFFYRGSERKFDRAHGTVISLHGTPLSLGATLFAGIFRDRGACAIEYMMRREAIIYPLKKVELTKPNGPVEHLFPSSTILQLHGRGEFFHPRYNPENQRMSFRAFRRTSFFIT